jgi:hypothetical protein
MQVQSAATAYLHAIETSTPAAGASMAFPAPDIGGPHQLNGRTEENLQLEMAIIATSHEVSATAATRGVARRCGSPALLQGRSAWRSSYERAHLAHGALSTPARMAELWCEDDLDDAGGGNLANILSQPWIDPGFIDGQKQVCGVCFGANVTPTTGCRAGHVFCASCYSRIVQERRPRCPECRDPVRELHGNIVLRDRAAKVAAHCEFCHQWHGSAGELAVHLGYCVAVPVKCPHDKCLVEVSRRELDAHAAGCGFRQYPCEHCGQVLPARAHNVHSETCPRALVPCPLQGCTERMAREALREHTAGCPWVPVQCPVGCSALLPRGKIVGHIVDTHGAQGMRALADLWMQAEAEKSRGQIGRDNARGEDESDDMIDRTEWPELPDVF